MYKRNPSSLPPRCHRERERYVVELRELYCTGELVDWMDREAADVPDRLLRELVPGLVPPEPAAA